MPVRSRVLLACCSALLAPLWPIAVRAADVFAPPSAAPGTQVELKAASVKSAGGIAVASGGAKLVYGEWTLTADEIRHDYNTDEASATGHVVLSRPGLRLLGESARYWPKEERIDIHAARFGRPPLNLTARRAHGTQAEITFEDVNVVYGEPGPLAPRGVAQSIKLINGEDLEAEGLRLRVGRIPLLALSGLKRPLQGSGLDWETRAGFDSQLGVQLGLGAYLPLTPSFSPGGSLDVFTNRGLLFGPGARYEISREDLHMSGATNLAYIRDNGDRGVDVLGAPVDPDRYYWSWRHLERGANDRWTVNGELNWWSDSAILRDFHNDVFNRNQEPDNFVEASWNGSNHIISALVRGRPNDFQVAPERLPEIRFDLLPTPLAQTGALFDVRASAAALHEKSPFGGPDVRSDRVDVYSGVSRTFTLARGVTLTPVAGGRFTHYFRAESGRDDYTRWLGEVGFDARMRAYSVRELKNALWGIDGIRHVIEPRIEYRYIPAADRGRAFIPAIDRPAFLTQMQPLGLANRRDIDALEDVHAVRVAVDNLFETRRRDYGSRRLARFNLATDFLIDDQSEATHNTDVHAELNLTPADWLDLWFFARIDPEEAELREFNARWMLIDGRAWSLGVDLDYLQHDIEQVQVFGRYEVNEANEVYWAARYDARRSRFNEVQLGLYRRLSQNWLVRGGVTFREGARRESSFGVRFDLRFLAF